MLLLLLLFAGKTLYKNKLSNETQLANIKMTITKKRFKRLISKCVLAIVYGNKEMNIEKSYRFYIKTNFYLC